ncbi:hypothetical protein [Bordetella tumulicola]|uniref:hypothetical protein n=1 Tax=Bordetella tumulicola TaxID=1649133 RepID=UPI0039EF825A
MQGPHEHLVTVAQLYGVSETALVLSMLAGNGIPTTVESWHTATTAWHYSLALDGVRLLVPAGHAQAAREVLGSFEPAPRGRRWKLTLYFLLAFWWATVPPPPRGLFIARETHVDAADDLAAL